ncbi:MAG: bestrophin family ion channel [Polyangiaceae bacterium]
MIDYDAHRWWDHLLDVKGSMVREIIPGVMIVVVWSAGVVALDKYVARVGIPSTVHSLVGLALGLLLVFRTNASYDRFWEGRKQWGGMVNETRNLARASSVLLRAAPDLHRPIVRWTAVWAYSAMCSLRGRRGLGPAADGLPVSEREEVLAADHVPLAVAVRITRLLNEAKERGVVSDYQQMTLDHNVQLLIDYLGACERIRRTPLPFAYVVHLRRALVLYCFSLPFALIETFGWATIGLVFVLAYTFFGIEEIGVEIEDPFGEDDNDLPLERICSTIEKNVLALSGEEAPAAKSAAPEPA